MMYEGALKDQDTQAHGRWLAWPPASNKAAEGFGCVFTELLTLISRSFGKQAVLDAIPALQAKGLGGAGIDLQHGISGGA